MYKEGNDIKFIKDGPSYASLFFDFIWLYGHDLNKAALIVIIVNLVSLALGPAFYIPIILCRAIIVCSECNNWIYQDLISKGWEHVDTYMACNEDTAQTLYGSRWDMSKEKSNLPF
jgi:hypothetical protein